MPKKSVPQSGFDEAVVDIVADLAQELAPGLRYQRLLDALRRIFPCDAAALLQLHGKARRDPSSRNSSLRDSSQQGSSQQGSSQQGYLQPLAVSGLSEDTLGRRFAVADQPRLARILASAEPVRFVDAELPDPYDGLVDGAPHTLPVHDCLGAALQIDGEPWGVLTLDALRPGTFDRIDRLALRTFVRLAEASVKAARTIDTLRARIDREQRVNQALQAGRDHELIGSSAAMRELQRLIETVAGSDLVVLILGETGVGKELVAQQLHARSARAERPLVYINCAALPETLAESELFGHRKGSFTGALEDRPGKFELADGGTLLLDEVGELSLPVQAKLLRVLQSGEIQRVGSDEYLRVDVRILAATNRDLKREVGDARFRADLYHRLSVFPLLVPPLRERGRDALALAGYFLERDQRRLQVRNVRLSAEAKTALLEYDWPGNVRELEHLMSRAALLATADQGREQRWITIEPHHLGLSGAKSPASPMQVAAPEMTAASLAEATRLFQQQWLRQLLVQSDDNLAQAARLAGMDRSNLFRLLKRLELR